MTIKEMREELVQICENVSASSCGDEKCPISTACFLSVHAPENMTDAEIKRVYAAYQEQKEGHNAPHTLHT
jgi:hypothetical protein